MMKSEYTFIFTSDEWETLRDGVADIACWHHGFSAANKDHTPPPQLQEVIDLIAHLKRLVRDERA